MREFMARVGCRECIRGYRARIVRPSRDMGAKPEILAVKLDADTGPLTGLVGLPATAGTEEYCGGIGSLWNHPGNHAAQLAGGEDRVE